MIRAFGTAQFFLVSFLMGLFSLEFLFGGPVFLRPFGCVFLMNWLLLFCSRIVGREIIPELDSTTTSFNPSAGYRLTTTIWLKSCGRFAIWTFKFAPIPDFWGLAKFAHLRFVRHNSIFFQVYLSKFILLFSSTFASRRKSGLSRVRFGSFSSFLV